MKTQTNIFGPIELPSKASPCNISNKSGIFILLVLVSFPSEYCPILHKRWNVTSAVQYNYIFVSLWFSPGTTVGGKLKN